MYNNCEPIPCCEGRIEKVGFVERIKMLDGMLKELNDILHYVRSTMYTCDQTHPADNSCKSPSSMDEAIDCLEIELRLALDKAYAIRSGL